MFPLMAEVARGVHEAEDRDVRLDVRGESAGAPMQGDAARLQQAFRDDFPRQSCAKCRPAPRSSRSGGSTTRDGQASAILIVADEPNVQAAYEARPAPFDEKRGGLGLALPIARRSSSATAAASGRRPATGRRGAAIISLPVAELKR